MMDAELRDFVRTRAADRCEYCRLPQSTQRLPFHVEHIVAKQHGGCDDETNLAWACDRCNVYKGTNLSSIDLETGQVVELFHPRRDDRKGWHLLSAMHRSLPQHREPTVGHFQLRPIPCTPRCSIRAPESHDEADAANSRQEVASCRD